MSTGWDAYGPAAVKPWETGISNPDLIVMTGPIDWEPIKYVSHLWLLVSQSELRVGIETQAATASDEAYRGRQYQSTQQAYGHPTLAAGAAGLEALYGGELLYKPAKGGWIINPYSGRYGGNRRDKPAGEAYMELARSLFKKYAGLDVVISDYKV